MATEYLNNRDFERIIGKFQEVKRQKNKYELIVEDITTTDKMTAIRNRYDKPQSWCLTEETFELILNDFGEAQDELAIAFYLLSENLIRYAKFRLIDHDDAVQEGVLICFEKVDRFDPRKGKAFNYMTTCILNHFRQLYRTARNYNELKRKYLELVRNKFEQELARNGCSQPKKKTINDARYRS
jgi:hypothetical protein